jgi:threonine/homoserine/homoserine lactone efflux protein
VPNQGGVRRPGGLLSGRLAAVLRRSRRVSGALDCFSGTVFAGLAVRLAVVPK